MLRRHPILALFTAAYLVGFVAWALTRGSTEFLFYGAVMLVLIAAIAWADRRVHFSTGVLWALSVWGFLHMAGGVVPVSDGRVLYSRILIPFTERILRYDQVVHAYGFGVAAFACWEGLNAAVGPIRRVGFGLTFLIACMSMGLGALNEVVEFIATLTMPKTGVGDYVNNATDLVFNMLGAFAAAVAIAVRSRNRLATAP